MIKKLLVLLLFTGISLINTPAVLAITGGCTLQKKDCNICDTGLTCQPDDPTYPGVYSCKPATAADAFGKIVPPQAIKDLLGNDKSGAKGISKFLTNTVALLYSIAAIIVVFMFAWGAIDWIISGGEKEKVAAAQKRIVNATIGIVLLAISFAIIKIFSIFTGFTFFLPASNKNCEDKFERVVNQCIRTYSTGLDCNATQKRDVVADSFCN